MTGSIPALLAVSTVGLGGIFSRWQKKQEPDPDQQVLDQLKMAGSDLSKPHNVEFFLYFPSENVAQRAADAIRAEVHAVRVRRGGDTSAWLCFASKQMVPRPEELVRLRNRFNEVARKYDGEYDGWGTEVVE
jgi:regulator of RNase E activity RraB